MNLKVALLQADLAWENPSENLKKFDKQLANLNSNTEIVVLPEVFSTGFTMNVSKFGHDIGQDALLWLTERAKKYRVILVGSILIKDKGNYFNRMYWMQPDGQYEYYDKRHLFQMGDEHKVMTAGDQSVIVTYKGVRFMLQVCYDLRFPCFIRNHYNAETDTHDYDVLLYIANWPEVRKEAYNTLLKARAIENQVYVLWVNRIGIDGHGVIFSGDTQAVDPFGKQMDLLQAHEEGILYTEVNMDILQEFRTNYRVGLDWDK